MGRAPCCDKTNVKRGPWSPEEDATLRSYLERHGTGGNWIALPHKAGLRRCGKSCRLRWLNYLRPDIKHGCFTQQEDNIICTLYNTIGSRWSVIASHLPGRTDNDVKNYWNTKLKKKLLLDVQQQSTTTTATTQDQTALTIPKLPNPDPVLPVPKVVKAEEALLYTPNYLFSASAGTGTGMEFSSSYDDEWILSELIRPDPNSFPIIMQSMANTTITTTANGQQLRLQEVLPPEDGYSSTTADHHSYCSSTGGQYGTDHGLFLQELLGFGSYSHEFLGGFGELMVNAPLIYSSSSSSSSSTKPPQAGIIYQNHVTNYYS